MTVYRLKGASGAVINQSFTLGNRTLIGAADDCDLRVEGEQVASHHAEILESDGALVLRHIASSGQTLLNGEPVESAKLASGDEIRIANCRWVLQAPGLRPEKVLTSEAVQAKRGYLPWLIVAALLASAALAWQQGWLSF